MRRSLILLAATIALASLTDRVCAQAPETKPILDAHGDPLPAGASLRLGSVAFRHRFEMPSLAFRPDGKAVAAPDQDRINVWELATGKIVQVLRLDPPAKGSSWWYRDVAWSPDGSLLVATAGTRSRDNEITLPSRVFVWDGATGRFQRAINRSMVNAVCFCGDNRTIAVAEQPRATVWDAVTGVKIGDAPKLADGRNVLTLAFVSRLKQLVAVDDQERIHWWKLDGLEPIDRKPFEGNALAVSPDGTLLAEAGIKIVLHDAATRAKVGVLPHDLEASAVTFSPKGDLLATVHPAGARGAEIVVWDLATRKKKHTLRGGRGGCELRFSPDGKILASADHADVVLRFWDIQTGERQYRVPGHEGPVVSVAFAPGGDRIGSASTDRTVRLWNPMTGAEVRLHDDPGLHRIDWSPDGALLASGPHLYDARDGKRLRKFFEEDRVVYDVALSADGKFTATESTQVRWWDAKTGTQRGRCVPLHRCLETAVSRDGSRLIALGFGADDRAIAVWDLVENRKLHEMAIPAADLCLTIAPDGKRFACGSGPVRIFDMADPANWRTLGDESKAILQSLAFAPHGRLIAVGRMDDSVELWDLASVQRIATLRTGQGSVSSLSFSPDGQTLASGGADSTVLLWRLRDILAKDADKTEIATLWDDLARSDDVARAYRAIERLAAEPDAALAMFRERVKPRTSVSAERLARLFFQLDADGFPEREEATRELIGLGDAIEFDLRRLQKESASAEVSRRAAGILKRLEQGLSDELRPVRAILAVEAIGTADAIRFLEELGRGAPGAAQTREAQAALGRFADRRRAFRTDASSLP